MKSNTTLIVFSFLLFSILAFVPKKANAAHLVGGELTYECIGGNQFRITLVIYRDCYCTACAEFDNPAYITIFNSSGDIVQSVDMFSPVITQLPITTDGLCIETVPDVCVEEGFYQTNVNLPFLAGGYQIVYQRCCRNNTIVNIVNPGGTGSTYVANVPQSALNPCNNSSPVFNNFPPIAICANSPLVFDHSATDADGDSLVYTICNPFSGATNLDPQPLNASDPPYTPITFLAPYTATDQLGGTPVMSIDPVTGLLNAFPNQIGQFVVGVCVHEYRDGVLLSTNLRDFQFNVTNCAVVLAQANSSAGADITMCLGASIMLEGAAFNGTVYQWSPATGLSNPNILNPIASPTQTTTYTLTVINPIVNCQDSDEVTIFVTQTVTATAAPVAPVCQGESVQLEVNSTNGNIFLWFPFDGLDDPTSPTPVASPSQTTTYIVSVSNDDGCSVQVSVTVEVISVTSQVLVPDAVICADGVATLATDSSYDTYLWSNGATTPSINVSSPGNYGVTVSQMVNGCQAFATATANVTLTTVSTIVNLPDVAICPDASFLLSPTDGNYASYLWSDGSIAPSVNVSTPGIYSVTVTEIIGGCVATATDAATVSLLTPPTPSITGDLRFFTGFSTTLQSDSNYTAYQWSNGAVSPGITVSEPGSYGLTVTDANGCKGIVTVVVAEDPVAPYAIPSAFSPNADGRNDAFMVITPPENITAVSLYVYNRWGEKVFSSNSLTAPWNGAFKGEDCPIGVYVYYGTVTLVSGKVEEFKGNVTLIR